MTVPHHHPKEPARARTRAELQGLLEALVATQPPCAPQGPLVALAAPRAQLAQAVGTASELSGALEEAAQTARGVAGRISAALVLWDRAREALDYIDKTISLRTSLAAIHDAIDTKNWDRAASAAQRARELPEALRAGEFAKQMVPSPELPNEPEITLEAACSGLATYFCKQFDIAAAARDTQALTRWFKLLPQVGHRKEGLQRYAHFVAGILAAQSRNLLAEASAENKSLYGIAFARLFEQLAAILHRHAPLVEQHYGPEALPFVISIIQTQVDIQGGLILDTWQDERGIEGLLADLAAYQYPGLASLLGITKTEGECGLDLDLVQSRLAETQLMLSRWQLYLQFIGQWPTSMEESTLPAKFEGVLRPAFEKMAIFVFRRSVERALLEIELPALVPGETPVSSALDQVTLVLSGLVDQALGAAGGGAGGGAGGATLFESLLRVLQSDYIRVLTLKANSKQRFASQVHLNDLETSLQYIEKIVERAREQHPGVAEDSLEKLVAKTRESVAEALAGIVRAQYAAQWAAPCRALCGQVLRGNYLVSPSEPESSRGREFEQGFERMVAPLRHLHTNIYNRFMAHFAHSVARALEAWILGLRKGVNELGSIALDRDLSRVIACVSRTSYQLREAFAKVAAMVTQLETGRPSEVLEAAEVELLRGVLV